ncbi:MAG: FAD-dependent oxidoreductase [Proteobacteria bacterium]|nr:FAD-dependent oxidoreductase [Pseudomonadota bacterium]HQR04891.1 FAD-dependent oxidoreductase [Rhodocyclaceae bacterium]
MPGNTAPPLFANYLQLPPLFPQRVWDALRVMSVLVALATVILLVVAPAIGLVLFWQVMVPALPLLFLLAPGIWRNICPMAALNQLPRRFGFTRGLTHTTRIREYSYTVGIALFFIFVSSRKWLFNGSGPATAAMILFGLLGAFAGGLVFKGKSGWCSSICPLLPVQRIYGQTAALPVANNHCQPCVSCTRNCFDFNPSVAYLADQYDEDRHYVGRRRLFNSLLPGFLVAFFSIPAGADWLTLYTRFAVCCLLSIGIFQFLDAFARVPKNRLTVVFGALAFNIYYWGVSSTWLGGLAGLTGGWNANVAVQVVRAGILVLSVIWIRRGFRVEDAFILKAVGKTANSSIGLGSGAVSALKQATAAQQAELVILPDELKVPAQQGQTLLELIEGCGGRIEAGCRMGACGADPVAIREGAEGLSPAEEDELNTLARLGFAPNTRMACCARVQRGRIGIVLTPDKATAPPAAASGFDRSIRNVLIIGNGIAGVTAADHVRRRHPECTLRIVADENHALYNRMGISRLVYGRSAMQGLYLMADEWYRERNIEMLLNTAARSIDPSGHCVCLADGETLEYDRLILACGSSGTVPALEGWGLPGCFVLRSADDAMGLRSFVQKEQARYAVVAGGGLLGLEAAYALHKLGLKVTVVERNAWLLHRQLDERGGRMLQGYLAGLGIEIVTARESLRLVREDGRMLLHLRDAAPLEADVLVMAAGITPNITLARAAGLVVKRGVVVDSAMRTSVEGIFAVGDMAEHAGRIPGLWPVAVEQAEVAACNALGEAREYREPVLSTMLKVVGADVYSMGRFEADGSDESLVLEDEVAHRYRKLVWREGRLVGAILIGWPDLAGPVGGAVKSGRDIRAKIKELQTGDWSVLH